MIIPFNFLKGVSVPQPFNFTVNTANISSGSTTNVQYKLPLVNTGVYDMRVDWGDGTTSTITTWNDPAVTHTYPAIGVYNISILGICNGWKQNGTGDRSKIILVSRWGCLKITTDAAFNGCNNMYTTASDKLDIATTNATNMFRACIYATFPKANEWDVSGVTNMSGMFQQAYRFNEPIGNWNTSNVTSMGSMFAGFNVSNTNDFNQDISNWNTSNVISMLSMFQYCKFNNGGSANINNWNTGKVTNMSSMFRGAVSFNQPIGNWDVSKVITMLNMFVTAESFNQPLNNWNTSSVTSMAGMFSGAISFNQPINNWNTSNVTSLSNMFFNVSYGSGKFMIFNQSLTGWNVSKVTTTAGMFKYCEVNAPINNWNLAAITDMSSMFDSAFIFNNTLNNWTIGSTIINMSRLFYNCREFDQNLSSWTFIPQLPTEGVDCSFMFYWCDKFNNGGQPLTWTIRIKNAYNMFFIARNFNQNIGSFQFSTNLSSLNSMFNVANVFNNGGSPDINNWQLTGTTAVDAGSMIAGALAFNQPLNNLFSITPVWNTVDMFNGAIVFNQNIGSWKFGYDSYQGRGVERMFMNAESFNNGGSPDINNWDFSVNSSSISFESMFSGAISFNQPIGNWILPRVSKTTAMFQDAILFNQDLSNWNAVFCYDTSYMFQGAIAFNNGGQPMPLNDIFSYSGKNTSSMFAGCVSFNQNINGIINTSGLLGSPSSYMFDGCIAFNNGGQPLNPLETYGDAQYMFNGCTSFNQNVGQINFGSGSVDGLFYGCTTFNNGGSPDINDSQVVDLQSMNNMFYGCTSFNQSLENWFFLNDYITNFSAVGFMGDKTPTTYPSTTYDALLNGWYNLNGLLPFNVEISFGTAKYTAAAQTSRDALINDWGWTIIDGGLA